MGHARRIYRDVSNPSILVKCHDCPWWYALRFDLREAYIAGENHEINVHGERPTRATEARKLYEQRHADT